MNDVHLHLILDHLPVVGSLGAAFLLGAALFVRESAVRRLAMLAMVLVALSGVSAYLSGQRAEEAAENRPGIEESRIERHEDLAIVALVGLEVAGAIALAGLIFFRRRLIPGSLLALVLAVDLGSIVVLSRVANLGGEITHPEIRSGAVLPGGESGSGSEAESEADD